LLVVERDFYSLAFIEKGEAFCSSNSKETEIITRIQLMILLKKSLKMAAMLNLLTHYKNAIE